MGRESSQDKGGFGAYVSLHEIFNILWKRKWPVAAIAGASTIVAVIVALLIPDYYRSEALLAPNQDQSTGSLQSLAAQYGGLASLAGLNVPDSSTSKATIGVETLQSRRFLTEFIERHEILVPLMAATGWDADTGELIIDSDLYDKAAGEWVRPARPPRGSAPSLQEARERFSSEVLSVSQEKTTGLIRISVEHYSPHVAKQWVDWLVDDINRDIMRRDVAEAERAIDYLKEQIAATPLADLQNVFFRLIEEQTKIVMLAEVSPEYLFKTIDPAIAPELKAGPKRRLIVLIGMLLGLIVGMIAVLAIRQPAKAD